MEYSVCGHRSIDSQLAIMIMVDLRHLICGHQASFIGNQVCTILFICMRDVELLGYGGHVEIRVALV